MINLLPPKRLIDMRLAQTNTILSRYVKLIIFSMLTLGIIVAGAYYYLDLQHQKAVQTNRLDQQQVSSLQPYHKQAEDLSNTINTIASVMSEDVVFSDMLTKLGKLMPKGAALAGLQLSAEDLEAPLVVSAQVDTEQRAAVLLNNLNQSDIFERAQIRTLQSIEAQEEDDAKKPVNKKYNYLAVLDVYLKIKPEEKS